MFHSPVELTLACSSWSSRLVPLAVHCQCTCAGLLISACSVRRSIYRTFLKSELVHQLNSGCPQGYTSCKHIDYCVMIDTKFDLLCAYRPSDQDVLFVDFPTPGVRRLCGSNSIKI